MSEPRSHECWRNAFGAALRACGRRVGRRGWQRNGRAAVLVIGVGLLFASGARASEPLYYGFPFHLAGPEACEPLLEKNRYVDWVECTAKHLPPSIQRAVAISVNATSRRNGGNVC